MIVENSLTEHSDLTYWRESEQGEQFRQVFHPPVIRMDFRLAELENATRNYGVTLWQVATRAKDIPALRKASIVMRAQSYRRRIFAEFDTVKELLLP